MNATPPTAELIAAEKAAGRDLFFLEISEWPIGPPAPDNPEVMDWIRVQLRAGAEPTSTVCPLRLHSAQLLLPGESPYSGQPQIEVICTGEYLQLRVVGFQDPEKEEPFPPTCEVYVYFFVDAPGPDAHVFYYCSDKAEFDAQAADGGTMLPNLCLRLQHGSDPNDHRLATGVETTRIQPPADGGNYPEPDLTDVRNSDGVSPESG